MNPLALPRPLRNLHTVRTVRTVRTRARRSRRLLLALWLGLASPCAFAVDANTATPEELQTIRGIGPALSARIVAERGRGPFRDLADLETRVRGVGAANLRRMREAGLEVGARGGVSTLVAPGAAGARPVERAGQQAVPTFVGRPPAAEPAPSASRRRARAATAH